ncbi:hypothetical protein M2444_006167 [Paenibacillus sp. PastF-3]|uniref:hypothetical protein n=1 Tax=unclassified Paenibacillus TaxID=185978 RepID=UPI002475C870|nr:hypothetical protein [Paenibacillus sp. PastF-3]MDH6374317.1 hypothetical protein [Paenibacillus sp. PastF-3]
MEAVKMITSKYMFIKNLQEGTCIVPIENISYSEMEIGIMYIVKINESDIGKCILKKMDNRHLTCILFFLDEHGEVSEKSELQLLTFRIEIFEELRRMHSHYPEINDLIKHLRKYPNIEQYDLDMIANQISIGIYNAVFCNCLRDHDQKNGTSLSTYVFSDPAPTNIKDNSYERLLRFVTEEIRSKQVTLMWALRKFELVDGHTILQVLFEADKTFEQFMSDALSAN